MTLAASLAAVFAAYLIGSLSFAVIVSRLMGLSDPRSYGSKNPGATNVLRSGNKAAAILTLVLDALKGYVPVIAALLLAPRFGWGEGTVAWVGLAAFVGHLWPVVDDGHQLHVDVGGNALAACKVSHHDGVDAIQRRDVVVQNSTRDRRTVEIPLEGGPGRIRPECVIAEGDRRLWSGQLHHRDRDGAARGTLRRVGRSVDRADRAGGERPELRRDRRLDRPRRAHPRRLPRALVPALPGRGAAARPVEQRQAGSGRTPRGGHRHERRENYPPSDWLAREGFPWPVLADSADLDAAAAYGVTGFPTFLLFDADGTVLWRTSGELPIEQLNATLAEKLAG